MKDFNNDWIVRKDVELTAFDRLMLGSSNIYKKIEREYKTRKRRTIYELLQDPKYISKKN